MPVTVTPAEFTMVFFDHDTIVELTTELVAVAGLPGDADVTVAVDERVPFSRRSIVSLEPVRLEVEGGALEDPKRLRHYSHRAAADTIGRLLVQVADRLDPGFEAPDLDVPVASTHRAAWDASCLGRLERAGYDVQPERARYTFRNRHGFTDVADDVFDRLWGGGAATFVEICALSDEALAARPEPPSSSTAGRRRAPARSEGAGSA